MPRFEPRSPGQTTDALPNSAMPPLYFGLFIDEYTKYTNTLCAHFNGPFVT
jgi:hypothetical protein